MNLTVDEQFRRNFNETAADLWALTKAKQADAHPEFEMSDSMIFAQVESQREREQRVSY